MMRSFIVLLLLVVVFLTGVLFGMDRDQKAHPNNTLSEFDISTTTVEENELEIQEEQNMLDEQSLTSKVPEQATQKVASFLETGVKLFYEAVVEVLFQISSLFI